MAVELFGGGIAFRKAEFRKRLSAAVDSQISSTQNKPLALWHILDLFTST